RSKMLRVLREGSYEKGEAVQISKIVQPGERIVEIGGGIGFISSLAARQGTVEVCDLLLVSQGVGESEARRFLRM
ncbi:MAG: hypothetical protein M3453_13610, partial [Pseudomonadota bacterium]|nr:hypothetical protein [Pseudomonadota bacterium]